MGAPVFFSHAHRDAEGVRRGSRTRGDCGPTYLRNSGEFKRRGAEAKSAQRVGRVEHVELVEWGRVIQGAPSLRDGAMKGECSHQ